MVWVGVLSLGLVLIAAALDLIPPAATAAGSTDAAGLQDTALVLVGHGALPKDYPRTEEFFRLHRENPQAAHEMEEEIRNWPRTEENDPYWAGFMKVVEAVRRTNRFRGVYPAFNESCAPTVGEALEQASRSGAKRIVVTSIMLTPGGVHSEKDIPAAITLFKEAHPDVEVVYAWPYEPSLIAELLAQHTVAFVNRD
ncbi:MAG: hypothetical protein Kow00109_13050 [Acidobacteriota bacterium]